MEFKACSANDLGALGICLRNWELSGWPKEDLGTVCVAGD